MKVHIAANAKVRRVALSNGLNNAIHVNTIYNVIKTLHSCHPERSEGSCARRALCLLSEKILDFVLRTT